MPSELSHTFISYAPAAIIDLAIILDYSGFYSPFPKVDCLVMTNFLWTREKWAPAEGTEPVKGKIKDDGRKEVL